MLHIFLLIQILLKICCNNSFIFTTFLFIASICKVCVLFHSASESGHTFYLCHYITFYNIFLEFLWSKNLVFFHSQLESITGETPSSVDSSMTATNTFLTMITSPYSSKLGFGLLSASSCEDRASRDHFFSIFFFLWTFTNCGIE